MSSNETLASATSQEPSDEFRFDGRVAVVTGASRGFGRATAVRLARHGARVVLGYRSGTTEIEEVAEQIASTGGEAVPLKVDLSLPDETSRFAQAAQDAFGHVDVLVNNAGVMDVAPFVEQSAETVGWMLDVNVRGGLDLIRHLAPSMVARGSGVIINLASQLAHVGGENFAVYAGTKAFTLAFTKSLARELGPSGINVNAVCPGSILTDMNASVYPTPAALEARAAELPLRRMGDPEDVARAVVYLASEAASFVTGQCVDVNGGSTMA